MRSHTVPVPDSVVPYASELSDTEPPAPELPTVGGFVQLPQAWHSSAGIIQNLVEHACGGVGLLTSRKGESRANHWHKEDWHYLYVISGSFHYWEWAPTVRADCSSHAQFIVHRAIQTGSRERLTVSAGQLLFTPPCRAHALTFLEDTVMISISKLSRQHAEHEADVVRL